MIESMRESDRQRFDLDLGDDSDAERADRAIREVLGVQSNALEKLAEMLQSDFDTTVHGFGGWGIRQAQKAQTCLEEPALVTMEGTLASAKLLIETLTEELCGFWQKRRANPQLLVQPLSAQWPTLGINPTGVFGGFRSGSIDLSSLARMGVNTRDYERLKASAVQPHEEGVWRPAEGRKPGGSRS